MSYLHRTPRQQETVNFVNFNQDSSCMSVGTKNGYRIFNCDPFGKCFSGGEYFKMRQEVELTLQLMEALVRLWLNWALNAANYIGIVEMLFCTSLVAVVGVGDQPSLSPRRLKIINTKVCWIFSCALITNIAQRKLNICELTFPTAVLKVKLNRKRLVVLLEEQIYIYDISNMQLLHTIETSSNPGAICALSPSSESYLAYPSPAPQSTSPFAFPSHVPSATAANNTTSPNRTGDVVIFDCISLLPINVIEAHKSPLSAVAFNADGTLLATSSDKGTIVRVFSIPSSTKVHQFRRGTYPSKIFSMNFNLSSTLLAVSSATETVHIFRLGRASQFYQPAKPRPARAPLSTPPEEDNNKDDDSSSNGSILPHLVNSGESTTGLDAFIEAKRRNGTVASIFRRGSLNLGRHVAGAMGTYLPSAVTEIWEPQRDFAFVKLPAAAGIKSVVSFNSTSSHVLVITSEGFFYQYSIDLERGGECELVQQYSLIDNGDETPNE